LDTPRAGNSLDTLPERPMNALALLASTFAVVFCLGLQSLAVNHGHRWLAFGNSFLIGSSQLILFKLTPDASGLEIIAFLSGGPFGIVAAMQFFAWYRGKNLVNRKTGTHQ
jgi:hypothetical protein